jgi:hypothetical protein
MPKPISEAGMLMVLTQPVCRPKYMLLKQMTRPTARPTSRPRRVKEEPSMMGGPRRSGAEGWGIGGRRGGGRRGLVSFAAPWAGSSSSSMSELGPEGMRVGEESAEVLRRRGMMVVGVVMVVVVAVVEEENGS